MVKPQNNYDALCTAFFAKKRIKRPDGSCIQTLAEIRKAVDDGIKLTIEESKGAKKWPKK